MRERSVRHLEKLLYFRRWSRKGYAAFASLGREVRICQLRTDMCQGEERKASRGDCCPEAAFLLPQDDFFPEEIPEQRMLAQLPIKLSAATAIKEYQPEYAFAKCADSPLWPLGYSGLFYLP